MNKISFYYLILLCVIFSATSEALYSKLLDATPWIVGIINNSKNNATIIIQDTTYENIISYKYTIASKTSKLIDEETAKAGIQYKKNTISGPIYKKTTKLERNLAKNPIILTKSTSLEITTASRIDNEDLLLKTIIENNQNDKIIVKEISPKDSSKNSIRTKKRLKSHNIIIEFIITINDNGKISLKKKKNNNNSTNTNTNTNNNTNNNTARSNEKG